MAGLDHFLNAATLSRDSRPTRPATATALPGYETLGLLGRGGMGVVYKARQVRLDRLVAVKMISAEAAPDASALARFRAEAQAIAHLQHPHIVQIYDIGEHEGRPFLALELVDGGSLSRKLKQASFAPREAARLLETVARAVHYAHQQGVVHRDLKPGNILLTADGVPKVSDFGLAKRLHEGGAVSSALTQTGEVIGTPSYMAPEQAAGRHRDTGPATDVWALGAILYELLTGVPPFEETTTMQTLRAVLEKDPVPPQRRQPRVPRDLETICLACLHKDPARRYASAAALADDLRDYLAGEPIRARPATRWERVQHRLQRRPALAVLAGVTAAALLGLLAGLYLYSGLAVACVAVLSLLAAGAWYNARLGRALRRLDEQHLEAERNVERLHLLLEATQRLMRAETLDEILLLLGETTTGMTGADRATIYLVDLDRRELWSKVALGDGVGEIRVPLGSGIAGAVAMTGRLVNLNDPYADPRFNPEVDRKTGYTTRNLITLPMKAADGFVLGVFQVLNKRKGAFDAADVEVLQALAASAAVAVERAQMRTNR